MGSVDHSAPALNAAPLLPPSGMRAQRVNDLDHALPQRGGADPKMRTTMQGVA